MKPFVLTSLLFVSMLMMRACPMMAQTQQLFPFQTGEKIRYTASIEMPKGYISGICVLLNEGEVVRGCLFNEFGVTALDFSYQPKKDKVKLHTVMGLMDKWYIRRVLRKDLRQLIQCLQNGVTAYQNEKHGITYRLTPMEIAVPHSLEENLK